MAEAFQHFYNLCQRYIVTLFHQTFCVDKTGCINKMQSLAQSLQHDDLLWRGLNIDKNGMLSGIEPTRGSGYAA
jgi:hypothetical protein